MKKQDYIKECGKARQIINNLCWELGARTSAEYKTAYKKILNDIINGDLIQDGDERVFYTDHMLGDYPELVNVKGAAK